MHLKYDKLFEQGDPVEDNAIKDKREDLKRKLQILEKALKKINSL